MLRGLGGGCQVPIGAAAVVEGTTLRIRAAVLPPDGTRHVTDDMTGPAANAEALGRQLAVSLLKAGAGTVGGRRDCGAATVVGKHFPRAMRHLHSALFVLWRSGQRRAIAPNILGRSADLGLIREGQQPARVDPGGVPAVSRWLSAATPPVFWPDADSTPIGVAAASIKTPLDPGPFRAAHLATTPAGVVPFERLGNRWCRCTQPPANGYDPSGVIVRIFRKNPTYAMVRVL